LFHHRITSILAGGTFVAQSSRNPPPAISLISKTLVSKSREASPHSFMFQYPPSHLSTRRSSCLQLSPTVSSCRFLWLSVAFCCFLWPFEASCGIESHRRNLSRVSPIVPICPHLSETVRFCPILSRQQLFSIRKRPMHKSLSYFFLFRGSLVSEGF
jgi:hypothetical protein